MPAPMALAPGRSRSTRFQVASDTETGASTLYVVANGIPSLGRAVRVASSCEHRREAGKERDADDMSLQGHLRRIE
jgi:hypothetical protein